MATQKYISEGKTTLSSLSSGGANPLKGCKTPSKNQTATGLYLVATPIGNAGDITLRALQVMKDADIIICEDTRVTSKLLAIHNISKPLKPYHEHNAKRVLPSIIKHLENGETVALVSDAGTPLISDPGHRLLKACIEQNLPVTALPGASATLMALVLSGAPTNRFMFAGFMPTRTTARRKELHQLNAIAATLIIMESPRRLASALADMAEVLGERQGAICREMTKMFEEIRRGTLAELAEHYKTEGAPKGEVTIVIWPPTADEKQISDDELEQLLKDALKENSLRDAATDVAKITGFARRRLYNLALKLKKETS